MWDNVFSTRKKVLACGMQVVCIKNVITFLEYCSRIFMKCRAKTG